LASSWKKRLTFSNNSFDRTGKSGRIRRITVRSTVYTV
jgi:hypothetical protein